MSWESMSEGVPKFLKKVLFLEQKMEQEKR